METVSNSPLLPIDPQNKMKMIIGRHSTPYPLLLRDIDIDSIESKTNVVILHSCINKVEKNRIFGIRMVDNKWIDDDFAAPSLEIYKKCPIEENTLTAMISASFLLRENQMTVMHFISTILLT